MHTLLTVRNKLVWGAWNDHEARLRAALRIVSQYALWVLMTALLAGGIATATGNDSQIMRFGVRLVAILASTWLAGRYLDRRLFRDFGLHVDSHWWADMAFGLVLGAILMTLIFAFEYSLGWIAIQDRFVSAADSVPFGVALLGPLAVFIAVGISEEILSRGYQLRNMAEGFNFGHRHPTGALLVAWLISSAIFGLLHASNPNATRISTAYLMLAGLFLGLGLVLTGRLGLPIGLHISWNFFQGNVFGFPVSGNDYAAATFIAIRQGGPDIWTGGAFGPEAGLISIGAILLGCLLTLLWVRIRYGHVSLCKQYALYTPPQPKEYIAKDAGGRQVLPLDDV